MSKKINVDDAILLLMLFQITLGSYLGLLRVLNPIILIIIFIRLLLKYRQVKHLLKNFVPLIAFFLLYFLNVGFSTGGRSDYTRRNILVILYPMVQLFYLTLINEKGIVLRLIDKIGILLNGYGILSIMVGFSQYFMPGSFMARNTGGELLEFLGDNVYGLFGYGQQHTFGLYLIFLLIYDFKMIKEKKSNSLPLKLVFAFILISSTLLFAIADNKAYFILLPLSILVYVVYYYLQNVSPQKEIKFWGRFLAVVFVISLAYFIIPGVRSFIQDNVISTIDKAIYAMNMGNKAYGTTERIAIVFWALRRSTTWAMGIGFDKAMLFEGNNFLGFAHFGQADLGSLLVLGGVWVTLFLFIFVYGCYRTIAINKKRVSFECKLALLTYILFLLTYTQYFSRVDNMLCASLFICLLQFEGRARKSRNSMPASYLELIR